MARGHDDGGENGTGPLVLKGVAASPGMCVGRAFVIDRRRAGELRDMPVSLGLKGVTAREVAAALEAQGVRVLVDPETWRSPGTLSVWCDRASLASVTRDICERTPLRAAVVSLDNTPAGDVLVLRQVVASARLALETAPDSRIRSDLAGLVLARHRARADGRDHEAIMDLDVDRPMQPWTVKTTCGAVDLRFEPGAMHNQKRDMILVKSRFLQPAGRFTGTIRSEGKLLDGLDLIGVAEDQELVW